MKKIFTILAAVFLTASVFAQSPEKMSYQAVIRNSSDVLVTDTQVGMQISILQDTEDGSPVYVETQTPTTNANGLVSVEIGDGTVLNGDFSSIDWSNGPYFIKTETDPTGGTSYTITGTSQLLSVPYALHAKTAKTVTGGITESDPVFGAWDKSTGISITESQISDLGTYIETETDPLFMAWDKDYNDLTGTPAIPADLSDLTDNTNLLFSGNYNDLSNLPTLFDGAFSSLTRTPTTIAGYGITDAFDGQYGSLTGTPDNLSDFRNDVGYLTGYTVTETDVTAHQAALSVTESQISDLGTYIETETDPSVPTGTQTGQMQYWNGSEWITVERGSTGQVLTFVNGKPTWGAIPSAESGEVQNPTTGAIWMDRNLGASQVATSSTDADAYGDLYQWGRAADGHELRTSSTTSTNATTAVPNGGNSWDGLFITEGSSPYDWLTPQDNNLWQGVSGTNNPCPSGYRLPTDAELDAERTSWGSNNSAGAFASPLKLPMAGLRSSSSGSLFIVGSYGYYWSSTVDGTYSRYLIFYSSNAFVNSNDRAFGLSVRCLKD